MTVEAYLNQLPGGWYPTAPSRIGRYLRYTVKGPVWGYMATDIVELESSRGKPAVMLIRPVTRQTAKKRGGKWRVRFFPNPIDRALDHYPGAWNRSAVAVHEAGHAVVAQKLGISIKNVTIEPTFDIVSGNAGFRYGSVLLSEAPQSLTSAIITLAGPLAEYIFTERELKIDGTDLAHVMRFVDKDTDWWFDLVKQTTELVMPNMKDILSMAQSLLFHRTVHMTSDIAPAHNTYKSTQEASA